MGQIEHLHSPFSPTFSFVCHHYACSLSVNLHPTILCLYTCTALCDSKLKIISIYKNYVQYWQFSNNDLLSFDL